VFIAQGDLIDGKYKILNRLGEGGMGSVFKAEQTEFNRIVAIKFLALNAEDSAFKARFEREALAMSMLKHRNIVVFYGFGYHDNQPYMCIEHLDGLSLESRLENAGSLHWSEVLRITKQALTALAYAHSSGIVHRDLKPSNIMLIPEGEGSIIKLIDFGLAKVLPDSGKNLQALTEAGTAVGTTFYMSPEQCLGRPATTKSDLYSLGCIMYECLTGLRPYTSDHSLMIMQQHVLGVGKTPLSDQGIDIPAGLDAIIEKAMAISDAERYESAQEMLDDLNSLPEGSGQRGLTGRSASRDQHAVLQTASTPQFVQKALLAIAAIGIIASSILAAVVLQSEFFSQRYSSLDLYLMVAKERHSFENPQAIMRWGELSRQALEQDKKDHLLDARKRIDALVYCHKSLWEKGQFKKSLNTLSEAIRMCRNSGTPINTNLFLALNNVAGQTTSRHEQLQSAAVLESALKLPSSLITPKQSIGVRWRLAARYVNMGDAERALALLATVPDTSDPIWDGPYASAFLQLDRPAEALPRAKRYFDSYESLETQDPYLLECLIRCEMALDHWAAAEEHIIEFEKYRVFSPPDGWRLCRQAHLNDWKSADSLSESLIRRIVDVPQDFFLLKADADLRLYAKLAKRAGRLDKYIETMEAINKLSAMSRKAQP
jgi:hypothetical protein